MRTGIKKYELSVFEQANKPITAPEIDLSAIPDPGFSVPREAVFFPDFLAVASGYRVDEIQRLFRRCLGGAAFLSQVVKTALKLRCAVYRANRFFCIHGVIPLFASAARCFLRCQSEKFGKFLLDRLSLAFRVSGKQFQRTIRA